MKKEKNLKRSCISFIIMMFLLSPVYVPAQEIKKSDSFTRNFDVSENTLIEFHNKMGDVKILTWDKNQVRFHVDYSFELKNANEIKAFEKAITQPNIQNEEELLLIDTRFFESITTNYTNLVRNTVMKLLTGKKIDIEKYSVHYELTLPKNNKFTLNSSYSDIQIDALYAPANLTVYDGKLELGQTSENTIFDLRYSDLMVEKLGECTLKLYDSDIEIAEIAAFELDSKYSKIHIKQADAVKLNSYDDKIYFDEINAIKGSSKYTTLVTTNIENAILDVYDCSIDLGDVNDLQLKSSYSRMAFGEVGKTEMQSYDDKINFRGIHHLNGDSKYTTFTIGNIFGDFQLISYDDNININNVAPQFGNIGLESKYSNIEIDVAEEADFMIHLNSRYSRFVLDKRNFNEEVIEKKSEKLEAMYYKNGGAKKKSSIIKLNSYDGKIEIN